MAADGSTISNYRFYINVMFKLNKVYMKTQSSVILNNFILCKVLSFLYYHFQLKRVLQAFHLINLAITMAA